MKSGQGDSGRADREGGEGRGGGVDENEEGEEGGGAEFVMACRRAIEQNQTINVQALRKALSSVRSIDAAVRHVHVCRRFT
eukprot:759038-Hanusia_phi.AAC.1